jgi:hypothetical protein
MNYLLLYGLKIQSIKRSTVRLITLIFIKKKKIRTYD